MDAKQKVEKLIRYLEKWCNNPNNDLRSNWEKQLLKAIRQPTEQTLRVGSMQIWYFATWYAQHGLLSILNGDPNGWQLLELSYRYRWWKMRIDPVMTQVAEPALLLVHALATNDNEKISWFSAYQVNSLKNNLYSIWKFSKLGLFGLELRAKDIRDPIAFSELAALQKLPNAPELGAYSAILEYWNDESQLAHAISLACDYHLEQALTQKGYPEFAMSPYNLLPIEYLALRRMRSAFSLETPAPAHPLLRQEFLNLPESWTRPLASADPGVLRLVETAHAI